MNKTVVLLQQIKAEIATICSSREYDSIDYSQLEYLIDLIDNMVLNRIKIDDEIILDLMDEIITTSVQQMNLDLLDVLPILSKIREDLSCEI